MPVVTVASGSSANVSLSANDIIRVDAAPTGAVLVECVSGLGLRAGEKISVHGGVKTFGGFGVAGVVKVAAIFEPAVYEVNPTSKGPVFTESPSAGGLYDGEGTPVSDAGRRLKVVGRNYAFGLQNSVGGSDIGGTQRKCHVAVGPISQLAAYVGCHLMNDTGTGATESATSSAPSITRALNLQMRLAFEAPITSGRVSRATLGGKETWTVSGNGPIVQTDPIGMAVPAGGTFASRLFVKPPLIPSGAGTATATAGGSLTAATYYYVVTRTEQGVESGPIAEFNGTTATTNLTLRLTWVDTRSTTADYYSIYRSAAAAGTKQFIARTNGPVKRFDDDGGYTADSTINPPTAGTYVFNMANLTTNDGTNHVNYSGDGSDLTGAAGTGSMTTTSPNARFGYSPQCLLGDDFSGKSVVIFGDSKGAGSGFNATTGTSPVNLNQFDVGLADGQFNTVNACRNGSTLAELVAPTVTGGGRSRLLLIRHADWVIDEHGTNDLAIVADWTALAANKVLLGKICHAHGAKFATTTLTPRTTSTDNCLTVANQTKVAGAGTTRRDDFNAWVRNGCRMNGDTPVITGGTPSPYIDGYIEVCTYVECNSSGALALNGGFWLPPAAPVYSGVVLTGTPTTTSLDFSAGGVGAAYSNVGRVIKMTSGARSGQVAVIQNQTGTTNFAIYANGSTSQSGIAVTGLSGAPSAGDTFDIYAPITNEGLHESIAGHYIIGTQSIAPWMVANITGR